ncbi:CPBP family intramembrane metalloprotease [Lysinibacillus yapensis]|uniref:CPBP family intramembrane metalloprotease n=1 Tax=Ureibacillus yapensis TaxID=2304605 RepID=A0A396S6U3_9BACL|nr:CPBP family glutamic-type intramembrane protease [Lysinibacillus yapensis]RHW36578.1 CPBP family intramembrane metalloprotease [Lysinibacillus yapensis]
MQSLLSSEANRQSVKKSDIYFSLVMRSLFFLGFGLIFVGIFTLKGSDHPFQEAEKWWPFQVIFANLFTFIILRFFLKKEGRQYGSLFQSGVDISRKKVREYGVLFLLAVIGGAVPLYLFSYLFLGSIIPPDTHFQALPIGFAAIALILFPLSNALVETPTYIGYALPRLQASIGKIYVPILLAGLALALQHVFLPIVLQADYMLWRLFSFIPLAIILGLFFTKTKRLLPIVIIHFLMDLQLILQMFLNSLR